VNRTYSGGGPTEAATFDAGHAIVEAPDGGFVVAGETTAFTEDTADADAWLLRLTVDGDVRWNRTYGGSKDHGTQQGEIAHNLVRTGDGGYLLAGSTETMTDQTRSTWLVRTERDGRKRWSHPIEVGRYNAPRSLARSSDGQYVLVVERFADGNASSQVIAFADVSNALDDGDPDENDTETPVDDETPGNSGTGSPTDGMTGEAGSVGVTTPGFGVGAVLLAIALVILVARHRR
jgi:hypothetical protein